MDTLLENPMPILFVGIFVEAILGVALVKTGRGLFLIAMIGVLLLLLAGVGLEALVVTDREQVEATLDGGAAAFVDGDLDRVLSFVAADASAVRQKVQWILRLAELDSIKITDLKINIVRTTSPPTARAKLVAVVSGREKSGVYTPTNYPVRVNLQLRQQGERWLVIGFRYEEAVAGL